MLTTQVLLAAYLLANFTCVAALAVASLFMTPEACRNNTIGAVIDRPAHRNSVTDEDDKETGAGRSSQPFGDEDGVRP